MNNRGYNSIVGIMIYTQKLFLSLSNEEGGYYSREANNGGSAVNAPKWDLLLTLASLFLGIVTEEKTRIYPKISTAKRST